jgi:uncharacterized repeat protein (TIGR01451 family)
MPRVVASDVPLPDDGLAPPRQGKQSPANPKKNEGVRPVSLGAPSDSTRTMPAMCASSPPMLSGQPSAVSVEVSGPATASPGQPLRFQIVVRNPGTVTVARVHVEQELPAGMRLVVSEPAAETQGQHLIWNLGNLEGHAERHIRVDVQAEGVGELVISPSVSYAAALGLRTQFSSPPLAITQIVPESVRRNGTVLIRLRVANYSPNPLTHVRVIDQLPAGLEHLQGSRLETDVGMLEPGQVKEVRLEAGAARTGRFTNEATVMADGGLIVPSKAVVEIIEPSLFIKLTGPAHLEAGQELELHVQGDNPGPATATGVQLVETVPLGFEFVSASMGGTFDATARRVVWSPGALVAGQTWSASVRLRARQAGDWPCTATVLADRLAEGRAEQMVQVASPEAMVMEVLEHGPAVAVGEEIGYDIVVLNPGNGPSDNVRLCIKAAEGLTLLGPVGPAQATGDGRQVHFEPLPHMAAHDRKVYHVRARGLRPGDWSVQVELTADQHPSVMREARTRVMADGSR